MNMEQKVYERGSGYVNHTAILSAEHISKEWTKLRTMFISSLNQ